MNSKKIICMLLALVMAFSLIACQSNQPAATQPAATQPAATDPAATEPAGPVEYVDPYADYADDYDALSQAIYDDVLGEFYTVYEAAKAATNVSERQALMAIAEAKLMASGVMLPLSSNGGNYAISRVAPYTATSTLWGNDSYRYHNVVVATEPLKVADRDEMKAKWNELKGTGTYEQWAKDFLTGKGYTLKDTYTLTYNSDPQTWDVLATSMAADSEAIVNTYDGLYEYDMENRLMPALAESYTVSEDGLKYTFKIREGAVWVDSQGRKVADVKADDFVAGMQHMMDTMGGLEYLVQGIIVNATEYITGDVTDFAEVGVKAIDDYTLEYTLCAPTSFFMTMLGYGVFAPMSRSYYESKGGKFGADFSADDANYTYGKTPNDIAYCGPYVVTNNTAENTIVFKANKSYWNADNINMKSITWLYNDGEDPTKAYNDMKAGTIDGCGLNSSSVEAAKADGLFDTLAYVSGCDATSFMAFVNLRRVALANFNDATAVVSSKTPEQVERSNAAMLNQHFRLALGMAVDRGAYNAQVVGEELKLTSLRNSYTPGNFISMQEEVTVAINGTDVTYPAGTWYGKIMQDQLDADGIKITVWDPTAEAGAGSSDGYDGWYNATNAAAEMAIAVEELKALGLEITAENPIYLDLPTFTGSEAYKNRGQAYKKSIEEALGGLVIINNTECVDSKQWYYAGYYPSTGAEGNYDICDLAGWGPDYGDPQTYLDTMLPQYAGYMTKSIGLF